MNAIYDSVRTCSSQLTTFLPKSVEFSKITLAAKETLSGLAASAAEKLSINASFGIGAAICVVITAVFLKVLSCFCRSSNSSRSTVSSQSSKNNMTIKNGSIVIEEKDKKKSCVTTDTRSSATVTSVKSTTTINSSSQIPAPTASTSSSSAPIIDTFITVLNDIKNGATEASFAREQLSDEQVNELAQELKTNTTLKKLDLTYCCIGWDETIYQKGTATPLADALKINQTLETLILANNGMTEFSVRQFANALELNKGLKVLDLSGNNSMGQNGIRFIANALNGNQTLTELNLSNISIGYVMESLAINSCNNKNLVKLDISNCNLDDHQARGLQGLLVERQNKGYPAINIVSTGNQANPNRFRLPTDKN